MASARTNATMVAKWSADLLSDALIAVERRGQAGVCVYEEGALSKIEAIRGELAELEAHIHAQRSAVAA